MVNAMAYPAAEVLDWVSAVLDAEVTVLCGLRNGRSPFLLRGGDREVILRVVPAERAAETATEVAAMACAARVAGGFLPVAELLGYDLAERTGYGLMIMARVPGTSMIQSEPDPEQLRALGAVAARISSDRPRQRWPQPGRGTSGPAWCTVTCGAATHCGMAAG
jgi:Ser/Thr protein kinase RdoA (MazF antagonist)